LQVKSFQTDGGGEYDGELIPIFDRLGIHHREAPPHTPQSNGVAERLNRVINESVRAMLYSANLPDSFWAEAAVTAAYIWNRLPSSAIENATPYERWFNKLPNYDKLKPFGCIVYIHVPKKR
jgi:transposase InsO family protein